MQEKKFENFETLLIINFVTSRNRFVIGWNEIPETMQIRSPENFETKNDHTYMKVVNERVKWEFYNKVNKYGISKTMKINRVEG